jgi:hypothetical protein
MTCSAKSIVTVMTQGIGANLTNDEKRAHLIDLKREHLIDQVCLQEILPPEVPEPDSLGDDDSEIPPLKV